MQHRIFFFLCLIALPLFTHAQSIVGNWILETDDGTKIEVIVKEDGTYMSGEVNYMVPGKYEIEGDRITIWETMGDCGGLKGVYKLTVKEESFEMEVISEKCSGREGAGKLVFTRK